MMDVGGPKRMIHCSAQRWRGKARTAALLGAALLTGGGAAAQGDAGWDDLVALDAELTALRGPQRQDGVPQFGVDAMTVRAEAIASVQRRVRRLDASRWSVAGKVDLS